MKQPFCAIKTNVGTRQKEVVMEYRKRGKNIFFTSVLRFLTYFLSSVSEMAFPQLQKHWLWPGELSKFTENTISALT